MRSGIKEVVKAKEGELYDIELNVDILKENEKLAAKNKKMLKSHNIKTIDIMGSIGSGKTSLIEQMIKQLKDRHRIAVFKGDLTTLIDAQIISRHGVTVVPINTGKECHLDANLVGKALKRINLYDTDILFIENVGNLICPSEFPLGSEMRIVVISVTEGPYMVVKHPFIFLDADIVAINKIDLADQMEVSIEKLKEDVRLINPNARAVSTNCRSGKGITQIIEALGF